MTRYRWAIPVGLAVVCFVLAGLSKALSETGGVGRIEKLLKVGEAVSTKGLKLEKGTLYELHVVPSRVPLRENYEVSAVLTKSDGDNVVFEVADSYWHERGVWREGGESGTWEEQNAHTTFQFRVPETDTYDLELSLDWTNGPSVLPVRAAIIWRDPWFLTMWPLLFGGFILLGFGGWTAMRAGKAHAKLLTTVGRGSKIEINGDRYEVVERSEHWESGSRVGVDLRLRDEATGADRYLSVAEWWEEYTMGEEDYERTLKQIYIGVPLTDEEKAELAGREPNSGAVWLRGQNFRHDRDNSGLGSMATERDGEIYVSHYHNWAYRSTHRIPRKPGECWLECTEWRGKEVTREWWLSELIDWKEIEVVELVDARMIHAFELQKSRSDPFGLRQESSNDPFGMGGQAAAEKSFQAPGSTVSKPASQKTFQHPTSTAPGRSGRGDADVEEPQQQPSWQTNDPNDPNDWN